MNGECFSVEHKNGVSIMLEVSKVTVHIYV